MRFQAEPEFICWRLHLRSPITAVYQMRATDVGRARFWAESAKAPAGVIHFVFPNHVTGDAASLQTIPPHSAIVQYVGNSVAAFTLTDDGQGGTDLTLTDTGVPALYRTEVMAGWVSVLKALKAAVDLPSICAPTIQTATRTVAMWRIDLTTDAYHQN